MHGLDGFFGRSEYDGIGGRWFNRASMAQLVEHGIHTPNQQAHLTGSPRSRPRTPSRGRHSGRGWHQAHASWPRCAKSGEPPPQLTRGNSKHHSALSFCAVCIFKDRTTSSITRPPDKPGLDLPDNSTIARADARRTPRPAHAQAVPAKSRMIPGCQPRPRSCPELVVSARPLGNHEFQCPFRFVH
jgi:hypothetical protein